MSAIPTLFKPLIINYIKSQWNVILKAFFSPRNKRSFKILDPAVKWKGLVRADASRRSTPG